MSVGGEIGGAGEIVGASENVGAVETVGACSGFLVPWSTTTPCVISDRSNVLIWLGGSSTCSPVAATTVAVASRKGAESFMLQCRGSFKLQLLCSVSRPGLKMV